MMDNGSYNALFWLTGVLGAYFALWLIGFIVTSLFKPIEQARIGVISFFAIVFGGIAIGVFLRFWGNKPQALLNYDLFLILSCVVFWLKLRKDTGDLIYLKYRKEWARQNFLHLVLLTGVVLFSIPFFWLLATSLKEDKEAASLSFIPRQQLKIHGRPVYELNRNGKTIRVLAFTCGEDSNIIMVSSLEEGAPKIIFPVKKSMLKEVRVFSPKWENYSEALKFLPPEYKKGLVPLWNTMYISILSIIGTLLSSSLVAYSFARLRWPGKDILFVVLLATMMLPAAVTMLPVFLIFRWLGWVDTLRPLWIGSFFGGAFNVFLLRQFFMTIPRDLEDAAKIDGCSYFGIYWRVMLPLIKPALAALTIMSFMAAWNNFMGPLIYISSPEKMPLAYALQLFQGSHGGERPLMMAASTLMMLPVLVVFFFTQRYFIQGITLTGMKG